MKELLGVLSAASVTKKGLSFALNAADETGRNPDNTADIGS